MISIKQSLMYIVLPGKAAVAAASTANYKAIVVLEKTPISVNK
jgi:hypothetical protein